MMRRVKRKLEIDPIDIFAGERVRKIRLLKGMTQGELAKRIGVAFQQIQKYESAANRISMSRLYLICKASGTTIPKFFTGIFYSRRGRTMKIMESAEAVELTELFFKMSHGKRQRFYEAGHPLVKEGYRKGWANITGKHKGNPKSHPVDVYVGKRIWQFRIINNMSRRQLSEKADVPQQQIQKYEEAINRVSVSRLCLICEALEMSLPEFFGDLYRKRKKRRIMRMIESEEGMKLVRLFFKMPPSNRKHFIKLGKEFVEG